MARCYAPLCTWSAGGRSILIPVSYEVNSSVNVPAADPVPVSTTILGRYLSFVAYRPAVPLSPLCVVGVVVPLICHTAVPSTVSEPTSVTFLRPFK
jgi:hypothetical protein